jgi:hypothetical protein
MFAAESAFLKCKIPTEITENQKWPAQKTKKKKIELVDAFDTQHI